jgi:hypothetical protein
LEEAPRTSPSISLFPFQFQFIRVVNLNYTIVKANVYISWLFKFKKTTLINLYSQNYKYWLADYGIVKNVFFTFSFAFGLKPNANYQ